MPRNRLLVIDGNSLIHRAFHALPPLTTSDGTVTNAVYGFTNMLLKVLKVLDPDHVAVAFDKGKTTFRHDSYAEYKAKRAATPPELRAQFPIVKDVLRRMRIPVLELENYEADDIIGTLACVAENNNLETIILTGDRDALQLVSPRTRVLLTQKGISETEEYDEGRVWDRYGISPPQLTDIKGLMGDASDNIPGVPGIGEKTAMKLIQEYGSLEKVIENAEELPPRWRNKITQYSDQALLSKKLATIECNMPLEFDPETLHWPGPDYQALLEIFSKLEFKTLVRNIMNRLNEPGDTDGGEKGKSQLNDGAQLHHVDFTVPADAGELELLKKKANSGEKVTLALEGNRHTGITGASIALDDETVYVLPIRKKAQAMDLLGDICSESQPGKIFFSGKEAIWMLHRHNRGMEGLHFDLSVAAYLLNPGAGQSTMSDLAAQYLQAVLPVEGDAALAAHAGVGMRLAGILSSKLAELEMDRLYYEVELPLVPVLAEMEIDGVAVDPGILREMSEETGRQIEQIASEIYEMAGEEFNINSTKQLAHILFEKMGLPVIKKTKTGYSTDASVLEELAPAHEIVSKILEYRQLAKLKSTYIDGLFALINPETGRIHTTFHQNVTATGRLSSSDPNLQNIPIRLEQGRKIRKVFVPRKGSNLILTADYSQIELRILAHMSCDPNLVEAFIKGQDIHTRTASEVFGVPMELVTPELRNRAKAVNFGIVYGISDFGLSRDIRVSRAEAGKYIKSYFARYSGVKSFIERKIAEAREKGYTTTILNRRRYLPDLFSSNRMTRAFGERAAINTPIQGSAADIIKMAMVRISEELRKRKMETKMILQVHDELIFDTPAEELEQARELVRRHMENALQLDVPLVVDIKTGPNWYDVRKV